MTDPTPEFPWLNLASRALKHAVAGHYDTAHRCVNRIAERHGPHSLPQVLLAWTDAAIGIAWPAWPGPGHGPISHGRHLQLAFQHEDGGEETGADAAPPGIRWAGRFVMARLTDDEDQANALVGAISSDDEWTDAVAGVLNVSSTLIRQARGNS